jgi:hypothetical protein
MSWFDSCTVTSITYAGVPIGISLTLSSQSILASGTETLTLTGTPTAAGNYTLVVTVNDGSTAATATVTLVVGTATITLAQPAGVFWAGTPTVLTVGFTVTAPTAQPGSSNLLSLVVTNELASGGQSLTVSNASVLTNGASYSNYALVMSSTPTIQQSPTLTARGPKVQPPLPGFAW